MKEKLIIACALLIVGSATICASLTGRWYYVKDGSTEVTFVETPVAVSDIPISVQRKDPDYEWTRKEKILVRYSRGSWPTVNQTRSTLAVDTVGVKEHSAN